MSETRKNHLDIEGAGQGKEDEHISTYKPIPDTDTELRSSKSSLSKSREKVDEAAEQLLGKGDNARVTTRVDMADAKYVVGDHRNGDAKIELDANKRQFSGLTKEELLKYADDPFWVRTRWFMFALFWALWLCMLVGAVVIIVSAPKCAPPPPKTRFQKGPLVDLSSAASLEDLVSSLQQLQTAHVQAVFIPGSLAGDTYSVLDEENALDQVKGFVKKAKEFGVGVIVDLTANFVPLAHRWFALSENSTEEYVDYFVWASGREFDDATGQPKPPNNWVSTVNTPAWTYSAARRQFYLAQGGAPRPDLNFSNPQVVKRFDDVLRKWLQAGVVGVRLEKARELLVNASLADESPAVGSGAAAVAHAQYAHWRHRHASDQPLLDQLLMHWAHLVDSNVAEGAGTGNTVFTLSEDGSRPELFLLQRNVSCLRPPTAAPRAAAAPAKALAADLTARLPYWPALQLTAEPGTEEEVAALALLLPAAPVLAPAQLPAPGNDSDSEWFQRLSALRGDASVEHGLYNVSAAGDVLVVARWKPGHTGYAAVWNPSASEARADVSATPSLPADVTLHHASRKVHEYTNYTNNQALRSDSLLVPPRSTVVLSYVPKTTEEK